MRSPRTWIYAASLLALLVPAAGIAYLGAVSYRDERGAYTAQIGRQREAASAIVTRLDHAIETSLDAVDRGDFAHAGALARFAFVIDADGALRSPRPASPDPVVASGVQPASHTNTVCTERLEECVRELATRHTRATRLYEAERAEACATDTCVADAKRLYQSLTANEDTGPRALLGLARLYVRTADRSRADATLTELEQRFASHNLDGLPVVLVVALMRGEGDARALLAIGQDVLARRYALDPVSELGVLARVGKALDQAHVPAALAASQAQLAERASELRTEARAAAGLAADVPDVARSAAAEWRGRPAARQPARTLIFRRRRDGGTSGLAVDATMLEDAAGHDPSDDVAPRARAMVLPAGAEPPSTTRTLAEVQIGNKLPHLALALVNSLADPDPLDEVIRTRSKRHIVLTSALALALGLGLLATIRGAARARELAQLKSDFVSTVSHELKTPLTSIRMFAEMLEQGVDKGDPDKLRRYQSVIIQESERLGLLIANLLDYAQIERGTRRYAQSRHTAAGLARHAVTTFDTLRAADSHARNPIEVDVSSAAEAAEVFVDRDVVIQAVLNLLANAAKYGGPDHAIEVAVGADDVSASIAVRDHGPGIPAHEQARVFREFYRTPEAYRSGVEGTGLGLALVKRHVEALGGSVAVQSELGHGATFTIRLPRSFDDAAGTRDHAEDRP